MHDPNGGWRRLGAAALGLTEDFWKNGHEYPWDALVERYRRKRAAKEFTRNTPTARKATSHPATAGAIDLLSWHAEPGEISEKMFGSGFVTPGGEFITEKLIRPLGLTKDMSVLDLSAGLGGRIRKIVRETGAYVTGLEPDAGVARRGMDLSVKAGKAKHAPIEYYDASTLNLTRTYDAIISRETFYRLENPDPFFQVLAAHLKSRAQIAFTDYIVDHEHVRCVCAFTKI